MWVRVVDNPRSESPRSSRSTKWTNRNPFWTRNSLGPDGPIPMEKWTGIPGPRDSDLGLHPLVVGALGLGPFRYRPLDRSLHRRGRKAAGPLRLQQAEDDREGEHEDNDGSDNDDDRPRSRPKPHAGLLPLCFRPSESFPVKSLLLLRLSLHAHGFRQSQSLLGVFARVKGRLAGSHEGSPFRR